MIYAVYTARVFEFDSSKVMVSRADDAHSSTYMVAEISYQCVVIVYCGSMHMSAESKKKSSCESDVWVD